MRLSREWEHNDERVKGVYAPTICETYYQNMDKELERLIDQEEIDVLLKSGNRAKQILLHQGNALQSLYERGYITEFKHVALHNHLSSMYDEQGRAERIKNFPFPRQYASVAFWTSIIFAAVVPFGLLNLHDSHDRSLYTMITPYLSGLIIWVFFLMEMIGDYSENPFEGTYNDVPISSIAKGIEIDLREMLGETDLPKPIQPINGFLM